MTSSTVLELKWYPLKSVELMDDKKLWKIIKIIISDFFLNNYSQSLISECPKLHSLKFFICISVDLIDKLEVYSIVVNFDPRVIIERTIIERNVIDVFLYLNINLSIDIIMKFWIHYFLCKAEVQGAATPWKLRLGWPNIAMVQATAAPWIADQAPLQWGSGDGLLFRKNKDII